MDKKHWITLGCAGLVIWEAAEVGLTGEQPRLPAGQPHIHGSTGNTSTSAYQMSQMNRVSTANSSLSSSAVSFLTPPSTGNQIAPVIVYLPVRGSTA